MMKLHEPASIRYTNKLATESTERTIIPTSIPTTTVKAIDVSGLSKDEVSEVVNTLVEYKQYYQSQKQRIFSFEDWVDHTGKNIKPVKWRTFIANNIELKDNTEKE